MKAIAYYRVSTIRQQVERQQNKIRSYCSANNITIEKEFEEKESGLHDVREILTEVLDYVVNNNIDFVIVDELSRFGRSEMVITNIKKIHATSTGFISLKESIKTDVTSEAGLQMANLLITFLSGINTFEISTFKYRSKAGVEKSVKNGGVTGSLNYPYGYKNDGNKKLVINDSEAEIIKKIFYLYLQGNGTTLIANYLNDNNIITRSKQIIADGKNKSEYAGKKWVDGTVYTILKNSIYVGDRVFKGEIYNQTQLQIIDRNIFEEVQLKLKANYNKGKVRNANFNYIIDKHLLECGVCGRTYYAHKRENGKDNRYLCLSNRYKEKCGNCGINIDKIENLVQEVIFYILDDKLLNVLDTDNISDRIIELNNSVELQNNNLNKLQKEEKNLFDLAVSGEFPKSYISEKMDELKSRKKFISDKISNLNNQIGDLTKTQDNIKNIEKLRSNFRTGDKLSAEIISKIVNKIIITETKDYHEAFNNFKGDKVVEVKIITGNKTLIFNVSQRTKLTYYYHEEFNLWLPLNQFFSGQWPKSGFNLLMGI